MIERDYGDELGVTLVDELMAAVDETIFSRYIERQLVPYTLHTLFDQVLDVVDVRTVVLPLCTCTCTAVSKLLKFNSELGIRLIHVSIQRAGPVQPCFCSP